MISDNVYEIFIKQNNSFTISPYNYSSGASLFLFKNKPNSKRQYVLILQSIKHNKLHCYKN